MVLWLVAFHYLRLPFRQIRTDFWQFLGHNPSVQTKLAKQIDGKKCYYAISYCIAMSKEVKYPVKHQCLRELHHEISGLARLIHWQRAFKDNIYYVFSFVLVCEGQRQKDGGRETETEMLAE